MEIGSTHFAPNSLILTNTINFDRIYYMNSPQDIIKNKPYLAWYIKDIDGMSDKSVLEHVFNYGDWDDVKDFIKIKGLNESWKLFKNTQKNKRSNYKPQIEHFFSLFFKIHAQTHSK